MKREPTSATKNLPGHHPDSPLPFENDKGNTKRQEARGGTGTQGVRRSRPPRCLKPVLLPSDWGFLWTEKWFTLGERWKGDVVGRSHRLVDRRTVRSGVVGSGGTTDQGITPHRKGRVPVGTRVDESEAPGDGTNLERHVYTGPSSVV